jgi:L-alanine-DL-glutamate epimerase-like enolase superfamily enzyme
MIKAPIGPTMMSDGRRITSLAAWDGSRDGAAPMRWSEVAPAAVPRQTLVSVGLSNGKGITTGVASVTHYAADANRAVEDGCAEASFSAWLGAPIWCLPADPSAANPYDPAEKPLRAAIELAVLDALGRLTGLPAAAFLGGIRQTRIEAYASLPSFPDAEAAVECACSAVDAGFRAVKFHASGIVDVDVETIAAARRTLGRSIALMWDASCAYELYTAVVVGHALAEAEFLWFEAPLTDDSTEALRSLASRVRVALVPDGLVQRSSADWARDVRDGAWAALRLDITRAPDVGSALRLLRLSETLGLPCEVQSYGFPLSQYSNLQLMLTTHACRFFEVPFPLDDFEDGIAAAPEIVDGFVHAPERPGLGHCVEAQELADRFKPIAHVSL